MSIEDELDVEYYESRKRLLDIKNRGKYVLICEQEICEIGNDYKELLKRNIEYVSGKPILIRKIGNNSF